MITRHLRSVDGPFQILNISSLSFLELVRVCTRILVFSPLRNWENFQPLLQSLHTSDMNKIFLLTAVSWWNVWGLIFSDSGTTCKNQLFPAESSLQGSILIKPVMNISQWKIPWHLWLRMIDEVKTFSWDTVVLLSIHCVWYFLWHGHLTCQS